MSRDEQGWNHELLILSSLAGAGGFFMWKEYEREDRYDE